MKPCYLLSCLLATAVFLSASFTHPEFENVEGPVTIYVAKKIVTMEPALPEATAVAVADGRIVAVGTLESLQNVITQYGAEIDETLADKILFPGFIDPHIHPSLPAVLTQFAFLAPDDWTLPTGEFPGARTHEDYLAKLTELVANHDDEDVPFIAWGFHTLWHGEVYRPLLDELFPTQPVILWHRSFHEVILNTAAMEKLGATEAEYGDDHEIDWEQGHFWELGAKKLMPRLSFIFEPDRYAGGMRNFLEMMHQAGVTTALDMGTGIFGDAEGEIALIRNVTESSQPPTRVILTPIITDFLSRGITPQQALAEVDRWRSESSPRVMFDRRFKLMVDGAIFSGLAQMGFPGYLDGHQGVWMTPPDDLRVWAQAFWEEGYQLHAHVNGDGSMEAMLDLVAQLQAAHPRQDHRTSIEHFAYSTEDQNRKLKARGFVVSANPYYQFILSDIYSEQWLGEDRGRQMVRLGSLKKLGVPFALHSDCPMAPLSPLTLAWTAVNRTTVNGNTNAPNERISVEAAMRAITIDAAWIMGWEDRIGSIRAGKMADFAVLEDDPFAMDPADLKNVRVWGSVFEGKPYPVEH